MSKEYQSEYYALNNAIHRCHVEHHRSYQNYGGRGIEVCSEWRDLTTGGFTRFLDHIGAKPSPDLSLDRIDNNLGYAPGNVRWATRRQQQNNLRSNRSVEDQNLIDEIRLKVGCSRNTAYYRMVRFRETGNHDALFVPLKVTKRGRGLNKRKPAVLKPLVRNRGGDRHARNLSIAADWDAGVPTPDICAKHNISSSSLNLIVRGEQ